MIKEDVLENDKEVFIEFMLQNDRLEKIMRKWKRRKKDGDTFIELIQCFAERDKEQGGLVLSVKPGKISAGAENLELPSTLKFPALELNYVEGKKEKLYAMVFTSRKRFEECNDTAGVVLFIKELMEVVEQKKELAGIVLNLNKEEIVFGKDMIRAIICLIEKENTEVVS